MAAERPLIKTKLDEEEARLRRQDGSLARPLTIEHGRGRSASRITFAALARTVFNLVMTPANTKPICLETSVNFKPLP